MVTAKLHCKKNKIVFLKVSIKNIDLRDPIPAVCVLTNQSTLDKPEEKKKSTLCCL